MKTLSGVIPEHPTITCNRATNKHLCSARISLTAAGYYAVAIDDVKIVAAMRAINELGDLMELIEEDL